jgi:hypothetical protein
MPPKTALDSIFLCGTNIESCTWRNTACHIFGIKDDSFMSILKRMAMQIRQNYTYHLSRSVIKRNKTGLRDTLL